MMLNISVGATMPSLNTSLMNNIKLYLPDKFTQQRIAHILSTLDAKIELNNRINAQLEAMAKTIYDYWFVQFDFPDANGKPYKSSGGKMVWNDELKREVPEGWEVGTLLDIATFTNGIACQKFRPKENEEFYKVIKIREMGTGFTENSEFVSKNIPTKVIVHDGDILFSWSATLDVKIWTNGTGALNQHIFKVTSKKYPNSYFYYELLNYLQHFKMMAELRKTTMGHITQDHLNESRISIPPQTLIEKLDSILKPILEKKIKLEQQNQQLSSLRDWLLPMLMNGQVSVGEWKKLYV
jgi:type I restriction enzyme S subunit